MTGFALPFLCLAGALAGCSSGTLDAAAPGNAVAAVGATSQIQSSPPPLAYQDVRQLRVMCLASTPNGVDAALGQDLCARLRAAAAAGAPVPVTAVQLGDPALLDPAGLVLMLHASVQDVRGQSILAFSVRPFRNGGTETAILFAAAPQAVPTTDRAAFDRALAAALDQILPWRGGAAGARPIN